MLGVREKWHADFFPFVFAIASLLSQGTIHEKGKIVLMDPYNFSI